MLSYLTQHVKKKMEIINRVSIGHHSIMLSAHQNVNCPSFLLAKTGKDVLDRLLFLHFRTSIKPGE